MKFKIYRFKKVQSTNNTAIRIIQKYNQNFGMIISELQKKGRGQYGKKWISYKGNLFISFFYNLENLNISINQLTKMNCILVKKLLSFYLSNKITIKEPKAAEPASYALGPVTVAIRIRLGLETLGRRRRLR